MQTYDNSERFFGWWYRLAAPPDVPFDAPLRLREQVRKGKLTSIALFIAILILAPAVQIALTSDRAILIPLSINLILIVVGIFLNRSTKILSAGLLVVASTEIGMFLNVLSPILDGKGLTTYNLIFFTLFVEPELFAVSLFPAWVVLPVACINSLFIAFCLTLFPKVGELAQIFPAAMFETYFAPISLQIVVAMISFLWVNNAMLEMKRANQAEEVNRLTQTLAAQQQDALVEKQLLEESVQQIVAVHMQVANGNFDARVPVDQKNVLWSIAGSLNNLLGRLQRWRQDAVRMQKTEQALAEILQEIHDARRQGQPLQLHRTGTPLDPLLAEFVPPSSYSSLQNPSQQNILSTSFPAPYEASDNNPVTPFPYAPQNNPATPFPYGPQRHSSSLPPFHERK